MTAAAIAILTLAILYTTIARKAAHKAQRNRAAQKLRALCHTQQP